MSTESSLQQYPGAFVGQSTEQLYPLLPAIHRLRDKLEGEPLRALLAVLESELRILETDISDLYDNWFIETCAEWIVPYIGDLLDAGDLYASPNSGQQERRAYVANTLAYRRRKGTTPVLEQLVRDVTGWRSRAVEFYQLLATTQNLSHPRLSSTTVDLRASRQPQRIGTPFEQNVAYLAEIRRIRSDRPVPAAYPRNGGRYNLPNVGLFVWRLQSYPIDRSRARAVAKPDAANPPSGRCYTFNPLGFDRAPLFNQPQTETDILHLAQEINVPGILRRSELIQELEARRQSLLQGQPLEGIRYFDSDPVLQVFLNRRPIPPDEILIASLADWPTPEALPKLIGRSLPPKTVAVDPELGRLVCLDRTLPQSVEVSYLYGFSGDIGGGPYERGAGLPAAPELSWTLEQATDADPNPLARAVERWNQLVVAWQGLADRSIVPLAQITVAEAVAVRLTQNPRPPRFAPGIVDGLQVIGQKGAKTATVTPGVAVDRQGRRIRLASNQTVTLEPVRDPTGRVIQPEHLLVISYRSAPAGPETNPETGPSWQLDLLPETAAYPNCIPLARLIWNGQFSAPDDRQRPSFAPGIVDGLQVLPQTDRLAVVITAGLAISPSGQPISLPTNHCLDLRPHQRQTRQLSLAQKTGDWQLELLDPDPDRPAVDPDFLLLAHLEIPAIAITQIDLAIRESLPAGAITGFEVSLSGQTQITLAPGQAVAVPDQPIRIDSTCQIDLSGHPGQTLILFVSDREGLGLSDLPIQPSRPLEEAWRQLGIVPLEPANASSGRITLADSATYTGSLAILLSPGRRLQIIAASGCRPHLQGNLTVQAATDQRPLPPNGLLLEGLLIEGRLTVLPGQLQRLGLNHCTLLRHPLPFKTTPISLTRASSLIVRKARPAASEADGNALFMAVVMYLLVLIRRILRLGSGSDFANPAQNLLQLTLLAIRQFRHLWATCRALGWFYEAGDELAEDEDEDDSVNQSTIGFCCNGIDNDADDPIDADNDQLKISLNRSICGTLQLADTVPTLEIQDSIIDSQRDESRWEAIVAPGTDLQINGSTVLGSSQIRSIEASDSLFTHKLVSQRQQVGCLRFCYLPDGSQTPQRYRCQPDLALAAALDVMPQKIRTLAVASQPGTGTISSSGPTVSGTDTRFTDELGVGSLITAAQQTRLVVALTPDGTSLTVDRPFDPALPSNTDFTLTQVFAGSNAGLFRFSYRPDKGNQWQDLSQALPNRTVTALLTRPTPAGLELWVGTASGGLFRSLDAGTTWTTVPLSTDASRPVNTRVIALLELPTALLVGTAGDGLFRISGTAPEPLNRGLEGNTNLTALVRAADGAVYAGTGGGVFRLEQDGLKQRWAELNTGLSHLAIAAMAIDGNQQLFVATEGGVFRLDVSSSKTASNPGGWVAANWGLHSPVTNLAVYSRPSSGSLSSQGARVTGSGSDFQPDWVGYSLTAIDQTKTIQSVQSATGLTLDSPFCPDLPAETPFRLNNWLYASTADGNLFRCTDGASWTRIAIDNSGSPIDVSALLVERSNLWIGTASGSVLQTIQIDTSENADKNASRNTGGNWKSLGPGLPNLEEKLLILNRLSPRFTSKTYGDPGYCQLSRDAAPELYTGAENGAEMGAFNLLQQAQREANLQASLEEYLRFGLEAGVFYVT